jgi:hypothetical protein
MKYNKQFMESIVKSSTSVANICHNLGLNPSGGSHGHISRKIKDFGLDTSHFCTIHTKDNLKLGDSKKSPNQILIYVENKRQPTNQLRRALIESGVEHKCNECGVFPVWQGRPLQLEINHIDGNWKNNLIGNLEFLCPNCHSQTPTHGYQNKKHLE